MRDAVLDKLYIWYSNYILNSKTQVIKPDPQLENAIVSYSFVRNEMPLLTDCVLVSRSTGYLEICFHFNAHILEIWENNFWKKRCCFCIGVFDDKHPQRVHHIQTELPYDAVYIRLTYAGLPLLTGLTPAFIANRTVDAGALWGDTAKQLCKKLECSKRNADRAAILNAFFLSVLHERIPKDYLELACVAHIFVKECNKAIDIKTRAWNLRISESQLCRRFKNYMGINPKKFIMLHRFIRACELMMQDVPPDFTRIALECGYYDQAHFIH